METDTDLLEELHPSTLYALKMLVKPQEVQLGDLAHIHMYTDGSHQEADENGEQQTAWSLVVIAELTEQRYTLLGFTGDDVVTPQSDETARFVGAEEATALTAEASGVIWSTLWWLQSGFHVHGIGATLHVDCLAAGLTADGQAGWSKYPAMALAMRGLVQIATAQAYFGIAHVKGHDGQPFNELANNIAIETAKHKFNTGLELPRNLLDRLMNGQLSWAWMHSLAAEDRGKFPPFSADGVLQIATWIAPQREKQQTAAPEKIPVNTEAAQNFAEENKAVLHFKLACNNVLSLIDIREEANSKSRKGQDGFRIPGRLAMITRQLQDLEFLMIGMMETRREAGSYNSEAFGMIASGKGSNHCYSCELWYSRIMPYATQSRGKKTIEHFLKAENFMVVHADPRRLLVTLRAPFLCIDVFVGHGPHSGYALAERRDWWKTTEIILAARKDLSIPLITFIDANAKVGSIQSNAVGAAGHDIENDNGEMLHDLVMTRGCRQFLPSTFAQHHKGDQHGTWTDKRGQLHRIDYIALPVEWAEAEIQSWIELDVDLGHAGEDHHMVAVEFTLCQGQVLREERKQKELCNRQHFKDKESLQQIIEDMKKKSKWSHGK